MSHFQVFQVLPHLPEPLAFLEVLSRNIWWSWQHEAIGLFRRIDPRLWKESGRNPIAFLTNIPQKRMEGLAVDEGFLAQLKQVEILYKKQILDKVDNEESPFELEGQVAYFSMEYGIHESIPLFSGGLGVLAGDHLKAASDMELPIVAIGLLYRQGYFHQFLNQEGWQQEEYPETNIFHLPLERALDDLGNEIRISVSGPHCEIHASVWKMNVGTVPLYLLDTNMPENPREVRDITSRLYGGGGKMRLAQEVLLGIGGMRALSALGISPTVCHMNEGHSAFAGLERLAQTMSAYNIDVQTALEIVPRTTVFTTHTPVAAGHDEFPVDLVKPYILPFEKRLGVKADEILAWGQPAGSDSDADLSMFVLGLRMSQYCNGVSRLHGNIARRMWAHVWPERPEDEIPISHVTNGVHIQSWISSENADLFERNFGPDWSRQPLIPKMIKDLNRIYDEDLWRAHEMCRSRLVRICRELMGKQYMRRYASKAMMRDVESVLDHDALTIAFGRRFATYKRASLLFHDLDRLEVMINSEEQPVQFIFAGKAHPKDNEGKRLIQYIVQTARRPAFRHRIIFLEDYDIHIARVLVQGADVWLNTPRRPLEACGTSGMKAAINGVLNLSILDGWWSEAYSPEAGWCIGRGEEYSDHAYQDGVDSQALYNVLENDIIPRFYERKSGESPARWVKMMKKSMERTLWNFSSYRMVSDYEKRFYIPADKRLNDLLESDAAEARVLGIQRERLSELWKKVRIEAPVREAKGPSRVKDKLHLTTRVDLGKLSPNEVDVELYYGRLKTLESLVSGRTEMMTEKEHLGDGKYLYDCTISCNDSGRYGFTARVTPRGDNLIKFVPGFITWAE
jgi:starch phosphorylase